MATYYKHKETGEIYKNSGYSNWNGVITLRFYPFNKNLSPIEITTTNKVDAEAIYKKFGICTEYREAQKTNDNNAVNHALETFDEIELNINKELKDTIIPGVYEIIYICPLCGSKMIHKGGAYLTNPLQYDSFCTNDNCDFDVCTSIWYSGSLVCGNDKKEVERIVTSGTFNEKVELDEYSRKMLRYINNKQI